MDFVSFGLVASELAELANDLQDLKSEIVGHVEDEASVVAFVYKAIVSIVKFLRLWLTDRLIPATLVISGLAILLGTRAGELFGRRAGVWFPVSTGLEVQGLAEAILASLLFVLVATNVLYLRLSKNPSTRKMSVTVLFFTGTLVMYIGSPGQHLSQALFVALFAAAVVAAEMTSYTRVSRRVTFWVGRIAATLLAIDFMYFILSYGLEQDLVERISDATRPPTLFEATLALILVVVVWYRYNGALRTELRRL